MKTTRDTLLVVFVSFISITELARCGASTILDDLDEETEELEELVQKEVFSSLQFLRENEDGDFQPSNYPKPNRNGNRDSTRYYQISNQNPSRKPQVSGNSYKIPEYSSSSPYYTGTSNPFNDQEVRTDDDLKTGRSIDVASSPAVSSMNTREPDEYSTTITLPSLGGGRVFYGGGGYGGDAGYSGSGSYGGGAGYNGGGSYGGSGIYNGLAGTALRMRPSALLRRGINRLSRYGAGLAGGNGFRYGLGTGGLTGLLGGAGLQGMNLGFGGGAGGAGGGGSGGGYYADYSGDGANLNAGGGRRRNGNRRYGLQGDMSGSGGSWSVGGDDGSPTEYYNLRYGYPGNSATVDGNSGGGSRRYSVSYPNDAVSNTVSTSDGANPPQYELMFLRNQQQNGSNQDADLQLTGGSSSGLNRDTSSNGAGYRLNVSGSAAPSTTSNPGGVEEYRVVVVNKDSPGNGSGRSGVSMSTAGSAPGGGGSGSWAMSSSGTNGNGGSAGRAGQSGFQITTPITSTQVSMPPTSIMGSVLSTVQGVATGEQTRSLSNNPPAGKFIQVIPVKTSN